MINSDIKNSGKLEELYAARDYFCKLRDNIRLGNKTLADFPEIEILTASNSKMDRKKAIRMAMGHDNNVLLQLMDDSFSNIRRLALHKAMKVNFDLVSKNYHILKDDHINFNIFLANLFVIDSDRFLELFLEERSLDSLRNFSEALLNWGIVKNKHISDNMNIIDKMIERIVSLLDENYQSKSEFLFNKKYLEFGMNILLYIFYRFLPIKSRNKDIEAIEHFLMRMNEYSFSYLSMLHKDPHDYGYHMEALKDLIKGLIKKKKYHNLYDNYRKKHKNSIIAKFMDDIDADLVCKIL